MLPTAVKYGASSSNAGYISPDVFKVFDGESMSALLGGKQRTAV